MPRRKRGVVLTPEEEREERAARKRLRTEWRTGATEKQKKHALNLAVSRLGGKRYSWMEQASPAPPPRGITAQLLAADKGDATVTSGAKSADKPADSPAYLPTPEGNKTSAVKQSVDPYQSHLPTPDYSSPAQLALAGDRDPTAAAGLASPAGSQATDKPSNKRKRGTKEEPITVSSREASPIVISSRDGSPAASSQTRPTKRAKKAPMPAEEKSADDTAAELEAELEASFEAESEDELGAELEAELEAAFAEEPADEPAADPEATSEEQPADNHDAELDALSAKGQAADIEAELLAAFDAESDSEPDSVFEEEFEDVPSPEPEAIPEKQPEVIPKKKPEATPKQNPAVNKFAKLDALLAIEPADDLEAEPLATLDEESESKPDSVVEEEPADRPAPEPKATASKKRPEAASRKKPAVNKFAGLDALLGIEPADDLEAELETAFDEESEFKPDSIVGEELVDDPVMGSKANSEQKLAKNLGAKPKALSAKKPAKAGLKATFDKGSGSKPDSAFEEELAGDLEAAFEGELEADLEAALEEDSEEEDEEKVEQKELLHILDLAWNFITL
ncbi:hypothetical protein F4805DRAFT_478156 [Annulohypoxylon moriforme]|nr:hypothetical protein F4805DRAFT_478156 [Annulohypoxylon moriforme]